VVPDEPLPELLQSSDRLIGRTVNEKYVIEGMLGRGAMAVVYLGRDVETNRRVALKRLSIHSAEGIMRFSREVRNHSQLHHTNIVEFIEFIGEKNGQFFLIMELAEGANLQDLIKSMGSISEPENIASIMFQLCDALVYAHQNKVVHRDLKTSNIILIDDADNDRIVVKVLDFGIARLSGEARITLSGRAVGSPLYMSPEQCLGKTPITLSDIYSLGIIAYEMMVGQPPYVKGSIKEILAAHCSPAITPVPISHLAPRLPCARVMDQIILKCLEADPNRRWQSASELKAAFEYWHNGIHSKRQPTSLPPEMLRVSKPPEEQVAEKRSLAEQYDLEAKKDIGEQRHTRIAKLSARKKKKHTLLIISASVLILVVLVCFYLSS